MKASVEDPRFFSIGEEMARVQTDAERQGAMVIVPVRIASLLSFPMANTVYKKGRGESTNPNWGGDRNECDEFPPGMSLLACSFT